MIKELIVDTILDATKYTRDEDILSMSASQLGNEELQNFLIAFFPSEPQTAITQATLGSLFHGTLETIFNSKKFVLDKYNETVETKTEVKMERKLPNGIRLHGTADLVIYTKEKIYVIDHKLTKKYAGKMFKKNPIDHQYTLQLNSYGHMIEKAIPDDKREIVMVLAMFYKDADPLLGEEAVEFMTVSKISEFEEILISITNRNKEVLDSGEIPEKCSQLWTKSPRTGPFRGIPLDAKCEMYCSQNTVCPYFKSKIVTEKVSSYTDTTSHTPMPEPKDLLPF